MNVTPARPSPVAPQRTAAPDTTIDIVLADDERTREAAFRLRYDVYVREMRRPVPHADHDRAALTDPLDETGLVLAAMQGDRALGTLRLSLLSEGAVGDYESLYGLDRLDPIARTGGCVVTALMIDEAWRRSTLCHRLFVAVYELALTRRVRWCRVDCNPPLLPMFLHFGFVEERIVAHPYFGDVHLMRLDLDDVDHLARVGSPFLPIARRHFAPASLADAP